MMVSRWTNLICGGAIVIEILGFLIFLPAAIDDYGREPEDAVLIIFWVVLLGLFATLCFLNARRANRRTAFGWRMVANFIALSVLSVLVWFGRDDPVAPLLLAPCAAGPLATLLSAWRYSRVPQS